MILIKSVFFKDNHIFAQMTDGCIISKPVKSYPNLSKGTPEQLLNYTIEGNGRWIHWEELDEDLSAEGFLQTQD